MPGAFPPVPYYFSQFIKLFLISWPPDPSDSGIVSQPFRVGFPDAYNNYALFINSAVSEV
jgi:hypothetical protein